MKTSQKMLPHVVIIGAGFGGMETARKLKRAPVRITLIDRVNYHTFQPLLYQVAIAGLIPSQIAYPVRTIFRRQKNLTFQMGEVTAIDLDKRYVKLDGSVIAYDQLVLAVGGQTNFFGLKSVEQNAHQVKNIPCAVETRNHMLRMFELASREADSEERRARLTFVVVGGGPTGVETAGALAELIRLVMTKDYPEMDLHEVRVLLLEAADHLMGTYPTRLRQATYDLLKGKGVEIMLSTRLSQYDGAHATLGDGREIDTHTVIWTAGVRGGGAGGWPGDEAGGLRQARGRADSAAAWATGGLCAGRCGSPGERRRTAFADACHGGTTGGAYRRSQHRSRGEGAADCGVPLQGPRTACHDRAQRGRGATMGAFVQRIHCMGDMGRTAHLPAGGLP